MKNNSLLRVLLVLGLTESLAAGEMSAPAFTKKPVVTKAGDKAQVNFTVNRETDVTVYIDDAKGNVIRHLVSGVLGTNAPAPLKSNSLSQAIEWDGLADYGKPAEGGPFKVRVALGLGAKYERAIRVNPTSFSSINALGVGPDGTVYVAAMAAGAVWSGPFIVALNPTAGKIGCGQRRKHPALELLQRCLAADPERPNLHGIGCHVGAGERFQSQFARSLHR